MSDRIRTALKGGGRISISIDVSSKGGMELWVSEYWERLSAVERKEIPAEELNAAEDPDGLLRETLERMVQKAHMNWEVHGEAK